MKPQGPGDRLLVYGDGCRPLVVGQVPVQLTDIHAHPPQSSRNLTTRNCSATRSSRLPLAALSHLSFLLH